MLSPDSTNKECLADFQLLKKNQLGYLGACVLEYQRIFQSVIHALFGWDVKQQKAISGGVFGKLIAWAVAHKEQARKTLHGNWHLWVEDFKELKEVILSK